MPTTPVTANLARPGRAGAATRTHGGRFERVIDQMAAGKPQFLRMALYVSTVDPRASYMVNPLVRAMLRGLGVVAKLRGVKIAAPTGRYGVDGAPSP